ncbi:MULTISPECIES: amidohydrolase family protein [Vagococcus]|uniref:amidohydrolase family protein n=1 Tax=Vagococcus TaxID=2737 RepID=UPI000E520E76|nr:MULTISPECIES: amidohydrolase family protein [Vagococcus]RHH69041.1 deaminase [Vagococcus sp. AM17-17]
MTYWLTNVRIETGFIRENDWIKATETQLVAIHIHNGKITTIIPTEYFSSNDEKFIDCNEQLLLPGIVEKHCHLDKSKLGTQYTPITPVKSLVERFETEIPILDSLDEPIEVRAKALYDLEVSHGVTAFRSHIDIEPATGLRYLNAMTSLRKNVCTPIELVAFPQHGLLRSKSSQLMEKALQNGANFVGGVDPYSLDGDYKASLRETFRLATTYNVGIDIHVHDRKEAGTTTIKEIIHLTKKHGWQDKVFISHAFGLNDFVGDERKQVFSDLAKQGIHIVTSVPITPNTIPPIMELIDYGVSVHLGCDNIYDCWSPYGDGSLQEKLVRLGELFNVKDQSDLTQLLGLMTDGVTTLDKDGNHIWPSVGDEATYLLTSAMSSAEFVARKSPITSSYYQGKQVK